MTSTPISGYAQIATGGFRATSLTDSSQETHAHKKLRKAAQEFESILISQLWGEFKTGFSSLTGDAPLAGSDTLNSLAIQSLSSALARSGGLGIGNMLLHELEPGLHQSDSHQRQSKPAAGKIG